MPRLPDSPVLVSYLEGVVREGDHSQCVSKVIEIWKGRYEGEVVALRVLKVSRQYPYTLEFKRVSMPRDPPGGGGLFLVVLTEDTVVLHGSGDDETVQAR